MPKRERRSRVENNEEIVMLLDEILRAIQALQESIEELKEQPNE